MDDLISRQAVKERTETHACVYIIDKLKAKSYSESEYGVPEFDANKVIQLSDAIEIAQSFIEDVEAVKDLLPQPKMGRWIGHREHCENLGVMPSGLGAYEWCSNCDCGIDVREWHRNHYNYCPNCGCRMESEEK